MSKTPRLTRPARPTAVPEPGADPVFTGEEQETIDQHLRNAIPQDEHLPGMEPPELSPALKRAMKRLANRIAEANTLAQATADDKAIALAEMIKIGRDACTLYGVELVHTKTDKLRVRLVDDAGGEGGDD